MGPNLLLDLRASADQVRSARHAITQMCDELRIAGDLRDRIRLATTEACTNCALHAYRDEHDEARFELDAHVEDDDLVVVVRDHGVGIFTRGNPIPSKDAGRGIHLIDLLSDAALIWSRDGEGTRITMRFTLPPHLRRWHDAAAPAGETRASATSTITATIHDVETCQFLNPDPDST
jgi:anti-sigma regulatory factor (Ser/Thr protein kinase)